MFLRVFVFMYQKIQVIYLNCQIMHTLECHYCGSIIRRSNGSGRSKHSSNLIARIIGTAIVAVKVTAVWAVIPAIQTSFGTCCSTGHIGSNKNSSIISCSCSEIVLVA